MAYWRVYPPVAEVVAHAAGLKIERPVAVAKSEKRSEMEQMKRKLQAEILSFTGGRR